MKIKIFLRAVYVMLFCLAGMSSGYAQFNSYRLSTPAGVNPSPLDFTVGRYSNLQIFRDGNGQLYFPNSQPNNRYMFNGLFLLIDDYLIAPRCWALYDPFWNPQFDEIWSGSVSGVSGAGTEANPWIISASYSDVTSNYQLDVEYSYVNGEEQIDVALTVTVPNSNTDEIKVFHIMDTYLEGTDTGSAYASGAPPYDILGVDGDPNIEAFVAGTPHWDRFASGEYYTTLNEPWNDGQLSNTLDTDPNTDNAIGVQWTLGTVTGTQPTITYSIGFTDDPITLECTKVIANRHIKFKASNN